MTFCKVAQCRFSHTHTTLGHKCGHCGKYGHGQIECGNKTKINDLKLYFEETLPESEWCSFCTTTRPNARKTHTDFSHNCQKCEQRHGEDSCIIQEFDVYKERFGFMIEVNLFSRQKMLDWVDNIYTVVYSGMGSRLYIRKKAGEIMCLFMHQDSWGQYGPTADDTPILNKFIENLLQTDHTHFLDGDGGVEAPNTVECPVCRTPNEKTKIVKAYGIEDKCKICMESNVERFFSECGHAVACEECFTKL
jgi:hypothetical protein